MLGLSCDSLESQALVRNAGYYVDFAPFFARARVSRRPTKKIPRTRNAPPINPYQKLLESMSYPNPAGWCSPSRPRTFRKLCYVIAERNLAWTARWALGSMREVLDGGRLRGRILFRRFHKVKEIENARRGRFALPSGRPLSNYFTGPSRAVLPALVEAAARAFCTLEAAGCDISVSSLSAANQSSRS